MFGEPRAIAAKGFEDRLRAWPVVAVRERAKADRSNIRFVDRRRELALLSEIYERAASRGRAHMVTLLGEPGIGKSRVVEEFLAGLPPTTKVLSGSSSPFEEEVTFWPLAQMVYRELGEQRGAPEADVVRRLREVLESWLDDPEEVERSVRRLGFALGIGEEGGEDDRFQAAEVRRGMLSLLEGLAARSPVVLVFEDLQQADPLMLDLIEQLVKEARRVPLMVVCVARWDFLQARPDWAGGLADAATLWVEALAPEHAVRLAMEAGGLDRDDAERVAEARRRQPVLHHRDHRHAPARRPRPAAGRTGADRRPAARHGPGRDRRPHRSPFDRRPVARPARLGVPARAVRRGRAVVPDRTPPGVARGGPRRGAADARSRSARGSGGSAATCSATSPTNPSRSGSGSGCTWRWPRSCRRPPTRTATRERSRSTWNRPRAPRSTSTRRSGRWRTAPSRRCRAPATPRDAGSSRARRPSSTRARWRSAGPEESWNGREAWIVSRLGEARYWLGEFDEAEERSAAGAGDGRRRRPRDGARRTLPRRHHAHDPGRRSPRGGAVRTRRSRRLGASASRTC